jgi:hypothetical protein
LIFDDLFFGIQLIVLDHGEDVEVIAAFKLGHPLVFPKVVNDKVMGNTHHPRQKFTFLAVRALFQGLDNLDKSVLEDVLCHIPIQNFGINKTGNSLVVPVDECLKGFFITSNVVFN